MNNKKIFFSVKNNYCNLILQKQKLKTSNFSKLLIKFIYKIATKTQKLIKAKQKKGNKNKKNISENGKIKIGSANIVKKF